MNYSKKILNRKTTCILSTIKVVFPIDKLQSVLIEKIKDKGGVKSLKVGMLEMSNEKKSRTIQFVHPKTN